jgi:hypothetical protein
VAAVALAALGHAAPSRADTGAGRIARIDGCGAAWSKDSPSAAWIQQSACGDAKAIAVGAPGGGRMMLINGCGAALSKDDSSDPWMPQTGCGGAKAIAVGDTGRMMLIDGCRAALTKDNPSDAWMQQTDCAGARAIAAGGGSTILVDECGTAFAIDPKSGLQSRLTACETQAIAVGGDGLKLLIDSTCGAAWSWSNVMDGWQRQAACGDARAVAVGGTGRMMLINGCGAALSKDNPSDAWTPQSGCGDATAIAVTGSGQMLLINGCGAALSKDDPAAAWTPQTACGDAQAIAGAGVGGVALAVPPTSLAPPAINGLPQVGWPLECSTGSWREGPTSLAFSWRRDAAALPGATGATHLISADDAGHSLVCSVTATNAVGSATADSAAFAVPPLPHADTPPSVSGIPRVAQTLTCDQGSWSGSPSLAMRWLRDGLPIYGALSPSYVATAADAAHQLACGVTATNSVGYVNAQSAPVTIEPLPRAVCHVTVHRSNAAGKVRLRFTATSGCGTALVQHLVRKQWLAVPARGLVVARHASVHWRARHAGRTVAAGSLHA